MEDAENLRQIDQMINFIMNEAKDRVAEIEAKSLEEFNIEKLKFVQQKKDKIRTDNQKKAKQIEVQKSISRSAAVNHARLRKIQARNAAVEEIVKHCTRGLNELTSDPSKYGRVITDLLVQCFLRLLETHVVVRCRKEDESIVKQCLEPAARRYCDILNKECGVDTAIEISLDNQNYLPPGLPKSGEAVGATCSGGIIVSANKNRIVLDNTLDTRLKYAVQECLPQVRKLLFPEK